jgi:hypothetical protein
MSSYDENFYMLVPWILKSREFIDWPSNYELSRRTLQHALFLRATFLPQPPKNVVSVIIKIKLMLLCSVLSNVSVLMF